jgi:cytosine/adenosine deaminase-related metal-dependent hydrolase
MTHLAETAEEVAFCPGGGRGLVEPLYADLAVGLGTDSRLSAGDLDLWKDMACAVEDYGWSPAEAVAVATRGGSRVLDLSDRGALAPGKRADTLGVRLAPGRDVWERLLSEPRPAALWLAGEPVYGPDAANAISNAG